MGEMGMAERVARALYGDIEFETAFETKAEAEAQEAADERAGHFDYGQHLAREVMLGKARAAIEALREPTPEMERALSISAWRSGSGRRPAQVIADVIDAALA